jgi:sulfur carrier protein ThiS adenylyltransferase
MEPTEARYLRQASLIPTDKLQATHACVIGVGAIGRQVALQLAALGVGRLTLVDFDAVDFSNVGSQGYHWQDAVAQRPKVEATRAAVQAIDPHINVDVICDRFRAKLDVGEVVFCCVDSISTRAALWRMLQPRVQFWVDGRMLAEVARILTVAGPAGRQEYARSLFGQAEAQAGSCTSRSTIYAAAIAAGLMVHSLARWLRGVPVECDLTLNLLAAELTTAASSTP